MTSSGELTYLSFPIEKTETTPDGDLIVYGKATDGSVDSDEQIVDPTFSGKAIQDWLATGGNVRVQHNAQRDPAGVGIEANTGPDGETWVKSLVIEPTAKRLVEKGALRAYSVGIARPKIVRDNVARGGRIVDGIIVEISLVDRPANKNCGIQLVKSAEDGHAEYVGKMFGDTETLTKGASTFSPADLAKLLEHREAAEKRQMDPNVGGGVDRDKIPASDFAGRDRSFPIVTPGDVSDAASSIGRAGADNYSSDELKRRITNIARRKGPSFVAELPESWKADLAMELIAKGDVSPDDDTDESDEDVEDGDKPKDAKKAFDDSEDEKPEDSEAKPDTTKSGGKTCPNCKTGYDADSKLRRCTECNRKLPMAPKSDTADVEKKAKVLCAGCGANVDKKHSFCPECGKSLAGAKPSTMKKNHKFTCLTCGNEPLDKGEKFCPKCGTENQGYLPMADSQLKISKSADTEVEKCDPGEGVVGAGAANIQPLPAHREPDGVAIEAFEHDAGLPTVPDSSVKNVNHEAMAAERLKNIGVSYDIGSLHDMLCPAYCLDDVAKSHPSARIEDLDVNYWAQAALKAAATAPLDEAGQATQMWQHAETLKSVDPSLIFELRAEAHKSYSDAQVGPGTFPTPMEINPTQFRRGSITAGHAADSPGHDGPNTHAVTTSHICANDFTRGPLTDGHAAPSPANKGEVISAPVPAGEPTRVYYTTGMRDKAKSAMQAMHEHIANTFPDLCPATQPNMGMDGAAASRPVPVPVHGALKSETVEATAAVVETPVEDTMKMAAKKAKKALKSLNEARQMLGLAPFLEDVLVNGEQLQKAAAVPQVEKNATVDALMELKAQLTEMSKRLDEQTTTTSKLQEIVNQLGDLPDPAVAAWKGAAQQHNTSDTINKTASLPVGAATVAEAAERQKLAMISVLQNQIRNSSDPAEREACWNQLMKMTGYTV